MRTLGRTTGVNGRHRRGAPVVQVTRRRWDPAKRAAAQQLDQLEAGWSIWYGVGTRRFYAAATWPTPSPLIVQARIPDELRTLMREAEQTTPPHEARRTTGQAAPMSETERTTPPGVLATPPVPAPPPPRRGVAPMTGTPDGTRTASWDLPHDPSMAAKARRMVHDTLTAWALDDLADDAVLVTAELFANAVTHGEPPIRLSLSASPECLTIHVTDHGPGSPRHLSLSPDSLHGRGLPIVAALTTAHGTDPLPEGPGKTIWARWHLPSPEGPKAGDAHATPR
ncbi:ATP-binding protein [Sphaerisporangium sp. NPDC051017]|uniref:ATP-binding protein n=1 Tax=Sphaerisporangium sp. NPDC051017 TaxID=3154636 RepID=UPI00344A608F